MPLIMRPPAKNTDDMLNTECLRQIARRKEQNRNVQRRLRQRKEEYTMQLEVQLAKLHHRFQSQKEESYCLREALARMRVENQRLAEQIAMTHQAVPSTQSSHPSPQRASIDLGVGRIASLRCNRHRSQSVAASTKSHFAFGYAAAPWPTTSQQPTPGMEGLFGHTIATGATRRIPCSTAIPPPGTPASAGGLTTLQNDGIENATRPPEDASCSFSVSSASQQRDSTIGSSSDTTGKVRHSLGSGTVVGAPQPALPSLSSDFVGEVKHDMTVSTTGTDGTASFLENIHSLPVYTDTDNTVNSSDTPANAHKAHFDTAASGTSPNEIAGQLTLSNFRKLDLSFMPKPLGLTPSVLDIANDMLGNSAGGDGWPISPWINPAETPSAGAAAEMHPTAARAQADGGITATSMDLGFEIKKSLASRRGFSGSLKFGTPAA